MGTLNVDSPSFKRILNALSVHGSMDAEDIAYEANVGVNTLCGGGYMRFLLKLDLVHVSSYRRNKCGAATPIYTLGEGRSVKKPRPYSDAEKSKRWRVRTGYRAKGNGSLLGLAWKRVATPATGNGKNKE